MSPTPNVNTAPIQGNTLALFNAIRNGRMEVIEVLLKNNPNWINSRNQEGQTPLHYAVSVDNIEIVKYLIKQGANINDKDRSDISPLLHAIKNGQTDMAICLIEFGADVLTQNMGE